MTNYEFDPSAYDPLINDMDHDRAVGKHNFCVKTVTEGAWPDGRPRIDFTGTLPTNGHMKFQFSLNPPDHPDTIKTEANVGRQRGMLLNIKSWKALKAMGYNSPFDLKEDDVFQIDIYREKPKAGRDIGYLRLSHIVGPAVDKEAEADANMPGF